MTKELKTLKDLQYLYMRETDDGETEEGMCIDIDDLRQEAIKWIKELSKYDQLLLFQDGKEIGLDKIPNEVSAYVAMDVVEDRTLGFTLNVIDWIKDFFNITEEELKDEND